MMITIGIKFELQNEAYKLYKDDILDMLFYAS
jgi:hypothetical protein